MSQRQKCQAPIMQKVDERAIGSSEMANHAKISLLSPSFFAIFLPQFHGNGTLQFPKHFVEEHWRSFSKQACLEVPTGEKSEMKMKMKNGRAWLHKGWEDFVQKYSIKYGYLLLFRYQGRSNFIVQIFDPTTGQIKYANTSHQEEVNFVIKEEECDIEDFPTELDKNREMDNHLNTEKSGSGQNSSSIENMSVDLLQREKAVRSRNPNFSITMKQAYVTNRSGCCYLHIPVHARSYFQNKGKDDIYLILKGGNGKVWNMKFCPGNPPYYQARMFSGWRHFSEENDLKEGDLCMFEAVSSIDMIFKVTISRKTDERWKKVHVGVSDAVSLRGTKKPANEKCAAMKCNETSFAVTMRKTNVGDRCRLNIPRTHSRIHLHDQHGKEAFLHRVDGKTWRVKCYTLGLVSRFVYGWKGFVEDNDLQVGDSCVFELSSRNPLHYKVAMFSGAGSAVSN